MPEIPNIDQVKAYFDERIRSHGTSPRGADWNSVESQRTRFDQLAKVIELPSFSILDYGCGTGALADHLAEQGCDAEYYGYDILESAIALARQVHTGRPRRTFISALPDGFQVDYTVASGIFNMRGDQSPEAWTGYVQATLRQFDSLSRRGFASNFLTSYSDADRMRPDLYYADPTFLFDFCKRAFSRNVALLHDYRLYDFTLIVRKD